MSQFSGWLKNKNNKFTMEELDEEFKDICYLPLLKEAIK
jgi:hypothetical protein